jgi:hypothetical protein
MKYLLVSGNIFKGVIVGRTNTVPGPFFGRMGTSYIYSHICIFLVWYKEYKTKIEKKLSWEGGNFYIRPTTEDTSWMNTIVFKLRTTNLTCIFCIFVFLSRFKRYLWEWLTNRWEMAASELVSNKHFRVKRNAMKYDFPSLQYTIALTMK